MFFPLPSYGFVFVPSCARLRLLPSRTGGRGTREIAQKPLSLDFACLSCTQSSLIIVNPGGPCPAREKMMTERSVAGGGVGYELPRWDQCFAAKQLTRNGDERPAQLKRVM